MKKNENNKKKKKEIEKNRKAVETKQNKNRMK